MHTHEGLSCFATKTIRGCHRHVAVYRLCLHTEVPQLKPGNSSYFLRQTDVYFLLRVCVSSLFSRCSLLLPPTLPCIRNRLFIPRSSHRWPLPCLASPHLPLPTIIPCRSLAVIPSSSSPQRLRHWLCFQRLFKNQLHPPLHLAHLLLPLYIVAQSQSSPDWPWPCQPKDPLPPSLPLLEIYPTTNNLHLILFLLFLPTLTHP
ncbi:hypothetical protein EDD21DRAFT_24610 [Dissophora ornata]|nr:hypothetical protein EDD21DRAFT_24610 [Dissophora ornata]